MKIHHLKLLNFRNYEKMEVSFSPKYNIIFGNNGSGKTNLVESIYVLALTKSFRGTVDKILLMNSKDVCRIEGEVSDKYTNKYKLILKDGGKKVKINNTKVDKLSDYISQISVVLFNPDDLRFIKDSPTIRRKAINLEISQINNSYLKNLNMYNKLLKQRNSYLKTTNINANSSSEFLTILTNKLVDYGEKIYESRRKYINLLNQKIGELYNSICGIQDLKLEYISDYKDFDRDKILKKYQDNLNRDIILGKTTVGIHHDDIKFKLEGYNIKDYGSEGQQKNAIIAYKLTELEIFYQIRGNYPILILDDLFSELDRFKINNILNLINDDIQTFITTTEIDKINDNVLSNSKLFEVVDGYVREVNYEGRI
ncbi:MAG: DNA replication/repair protein RecF [Bacilli bacterium]|nr:DNA replication/repair protein RecF [Bacilli bacterium]